MSGKRYKLCFTIFTHLLGIHNNSETVLIFHIFDTERSIYFGVTSHTYHTSHTVNGVNRVPTLFTAHPLFPSTTVDFYQQIYETHAPSGSNFFHFHAVFGKKLFQIIGWHLHLGVDTPSVWEVQDLPLVFVMFSNKSQYKKLVSCVCTLFTTFTILQMPDTTNTTYFNYFHLTGMKSF